MARPDRDLSALSRLDDAVLDLDAWHHAEIEAGLKDAAAGDFVSAAEAADAFGPFAVDALGTAVFASGAEQPSCATLTESALPWVTLLRS